MKKIFHWLRHWIIIAGIGFAAIFWLLHLVLNQFSLEYRQWAAYTVLLISLILIVWGIFQLALKIRKKPVKIAVTTLLAVLLLAASPYVLFLAGFSHLPEHVVIKNETKLVGYVNGFMHTNVSYYDYKNIFVRSTRLRLYEDYGSGGFDPIENYMGIVYQPEKQTWYDDNGNPMKER